MTHLVQGDCTSHPSIHFGMRVRLESVDHAFEQGASAALNMLGIATVHDKVPWFWSDQFDLDDRAPQADTAHLSVVRFYLCANRACERAERADCAA